MSDSNNSLSIPQFIGAGLLLFYGVCTFANAADQVLKGNSATESCHQIHDYNRRLSIALAFNVMWPISGFLKF